MTVKTIKFSAPQFEFLHAKEKYVAAVAGFGSGKTFVGFCRIIQNMIQSPGIDQAYLAPTYPLIRDIFYPAVSEFLSDWGIRYTINRSEHIVSLQGLGKIFCRTMENPENIVGWKVADVVLDEFDVLKVDKARHVMRKVVARARQVNPCGRKNQIFVTTTPEGFKATYEFFKKTPLKDSRLIQMSTYSNKDNLPDDYIDTLIAQYPANLIQAYIDGQFVNLTSGTVYYSYNRIAQRSTETIHSTDTLYIGQDFNVGKMASTIYVKREKVWHAVAELIDVFDTPALIKMINEKYPNNKIIIYPDASGSARKAVNASTSDIALLSQDRFIVRSNKKNPFVKDRVLAVNSAFEKGLLFINDDACPSVSAALEQQAYDKNGEPEHEGREHSNDATGYPIVFEMPILKPVVMYTGIHSAAQY